MGFRTFYIYTGILMASILALTGCTTTPMQPNASTTPTSASPVLSTSAPEVDLGKLVTKADELSAIDAKKRELAGIQLFGAVTARPSLTGPVTHPTTMTIHDRNETEHPPGTYRLVVTCAGQGTIQATYSIETQETKKTLRCQPEGSSDSLDISISKTASPSDAHLEPANRASMAIAYRIEKLK